MNTPKKTVISFPFILLAAVLVAPPRYHTPARRPPKSALQQNRTLEMWARLACSNDKVGLGLIAPVCLSTGRFRSATINGHHQTSPADPLRAQTRKSISPDGFSPREPQFRIGRPHARFRQPELPADDIRTLDQCHTLVKCDAPRQPLAAKAAIGGDHQPLGRDVFERLADQRGDMLCRLDGGDAVIDDADADLLIGLVLGEERQVPAVARPGPPGSYWGSLFKRRDDAHIRDYRIDIRLGHAAKPRLASHRCLKGSSVARHALSKRSLDLRIGPFADP